VTSLWLPSGLISVAARAPSRSEITHSIIIQFSWHNTTTLQAGMTKKRD
jgi:hypothetical protein